MAFANPSGGVIVQSGTDNDLSGLNGLTGVTVFSTTHLNIYYLGTNRLRVDGTLNINSATDADREMLVLGVDGTTQNVDIDISNGAILRVGSLDTQGLVDFNQEQFWPSIYEDANIDFTEGSGNISTDGGTSDAFINVEGGGRLELYGCINMTGGIRFKGIRDGASGIDSEIIIRGGVLDMRRLTERSSGEADGFIYNYSDGLDILPPNGDTIGFTILTSPVTGASEKGYAIIQLGQPVNLKGYRPVFSSQALGGSNSAPIDLTYTVEDYTGIIGISGVDNIDLRSASSSAANTSIITFLNSIKGSDLNLATQDPGYNEIEAKETVRVSTVDSLGVTRSNALVATQNKNAVITSGASTLGDILLTEWDNSNPPLPTYNNPSNTDDDLWDFYAYSLRGINRNRIGVLLRGTGGIDVDFISPDDTALSETNDAVISSYTSVDNDDKFYDFFKLYKLNNLGFPELKTPIALAAGNTIDVGDLNVIIDGAYSSAGEGVGTDVIINPNSLPAVNLIGATESESSGTASSISISYPAGIQVDDVAYIIVGHSESDSNTWTTPAGWTLLVDNFKTGGVAVSRAGVSIFRKVLVSDSGSQIVTGSFSSGLVAQMIVYRNIDTVNPEDVSFTSATGNNANPDSPSITTITDDSKIISIGFMDDGNQNLVSLPTGYNLINETKTIDGAPA